jgi:adenylate cyclase
VRDDKAQPEADLSERQATVLFADLSGSAELCEALGDAAALETIAGCLRMASEATAGAGGRVVKTIGHGLMAIFGSADAAATAAAEAQGRVSATPELGGVRLGLRIGLHHGAVLQQGDDVFGDTVNLAARLLALAKKGEIITSEATVGLLSPGFRAMARNLHAISVKGKSDEVDLAELLWRSDATTTIGASPQAAPKPAAATRLRLRYRGREILRRRAEDSIGLGRDTASGLVVDDEMASRSHCTIERRQDQFVLRDHSTNGTYVTHEGDTERLLRREELVLGKHGWIALGQPRESAPEVVEFFCD